MMHHSSFGRKKSGNRVGVANSDTVFFIIPLLGLTGLGLPVLNHHGHACACSILVPRSPKSMYGRDFSLKSLKTPGLHQIQVEGINPMIIAKHLTALTKVQYHALGDSVYFVNPAGL